jgi:outer membrane protein OmpU
MKKVLYSSTALAAAAAIALIPTGDAVAAEKAKKIQLGFGGGMTALMGFANNESSFENSSSADVAGITGYEEFGLWTNTEVEVKGSVKLDSGITVSVEVEFEGDQVTVNAGNAGVDHSYMRITGGFGDIRVGSTAPITAVLAQTAPWTGAIMPGVEDVFWVKQPTGSAAFGPMGKMSTTNGADDAIKLQYLTPQFGGLRGGVYYQPNSSKTEVVASSGGVSGTEAQEFGVSANFETKLGSVTVKADVGRWQRRGQAIDSVNNTRFGAKLSFGDITVGGSYKKQANAHSGVEGTTNSDDDRRFDVGVLFKPKGYSVGVHYLSGKRELSTAVAGDDQKAILSLGATYDLGPGVSAVGTVFMVDYEDETTADSLNNKGWAAVAGIKVRF